jgi:hypothetical protein
MKPHHGHSHSHSHNCASFAPGITDALDALDGAGRRA